MIFTTRAEWEIKDPTLKALGEDETTRTYPLIEIHLNVPIFHVDVLIWYDEDGGYSLWSRFITADIDLVKKLIKQDRITKYNIYLETPRDVHKDSLERHKVKKLSKVVSGEDKNGCIVEAYIFADGDTYISGDVDSIDDIKNARVIFDINEVKR